MIGSKADVGKRGELAAVNFLTQNGYRILERNFKTKLGEMDIIAQDGATVCFIEVKTRKSQFFGSGWEAITLQKKQKLILVAKSYLKQKKLNDEKARFDVISVELDALFKENVEIVKNAFELND